uniref:V-type proton ATPase subunit E n=1 Tax=Oryza punctata TaxID=4537 RepID=A0A0E0JLY7_ORYPU
MDRVHGMIAYAADRVAATKGSTLPRPARPLTSPTTTSPSLPLSTTPVDSSLFSPPLPRAVVVVAGEQQQQPRGPSGSAAAKMNDADVAKQIQQMVRFIRQEAEEKASEISVSAEEEFNIEKLQLVEAEKKKIRQEYERKEKQVELNASRIKVLQAQDDLVNSMKEDATKQLLRVSHNHHEYKNLLKELVVQGLLRLKEPAVLLRCRKEDHHHVESVLHSAKHEYGSKAEVHHPEILVDHDVYLPSSPSSHDSHEISGGVVLASRDGKIVCENTLDARLEVVFRKKLPEIRKLLFGQAMA